ncbi:hypothetical protein [Nitrobacter sp.]|uniref:hypothetical protein n=1 Tax=Nitrobacter sp. TaxID=29420 RepID=UPI001D1FB6A5|nr:hypothetical protein [Nitrobacter sp.]MCB1393846.1 hypothetical protein [Nitrobacter sp.]
MLDFAEDTVSERASKPNVVDFTTAATASRAPGSRRAHLPDHPDAELIQACVEFGIAVRGASGGFEADPTGDNEFAQRMDTALLKRARKQQKLIATLRPTTLDGLRAKATVANMARTFDLDQSSALLSSLCTDVTQVHRSSKNTAAVVLT